MKTDNIIAIEELVQAVINAINNIIDKKNILCIRSGRIKEKTEKGYIVIIEQQEFLIKSQLVFNINDTVDVLTDNKLQNKKFILG